MSRENVKLVLVAAFCTVVGLAGPSMADGVRHAMFAHQAGHAAAADRADTVDGRHAVGASSGPAKRAKKLVATNGRGRLPNSIIAKAPDASRLDGLPPSAYLTYWLSVRANGDIRSRSVGMEGATVSKIAGNGRYCVSLPDGLEVQTEAALGSIQETVGGTQRYGITVSTTQSSACDVIGAWDIAVLTHRNDGVADGAFMLMVPGTPVSAG